MSLKDDLESRVRDIYYYAWNISEAEVVPDADSLTFDNVGKTLTATVLYADLDGSTDLVDTYKATFAAEIYKAYLYCAGRIINANDGAITAYDGDRVMAIYTGKSKNTNAVTTALNINWAVINIINPLIKKQYPSEDYVVRHTIGVDTSDLLAVKTGVRGDNDLVWVGRAANHAAKLTTLGSYRPVVITNEIYTNMNKSVKYDASGNDLWPQEFNDLIGRYIHRGDNWMPIS